MKILESVLWNTAEALELENYLPAYASQVKTEFLTTVRVPLDDDYVWHYYFFQSKDDEDLFLFRSNEEHIVSHVLILPEYKDDLSVHEDFVEQLVMNFEVPPLIILHFLSLPEPLKKFLEKGGIFVEDNLVITFQQEETFPFARWNHLSATYLREKVLANQSK